MRINGRTVVVGDVVTVKRREEAYYSTYGGNPECWLEPGEIATVKSVDVPAVTSNRTFVCADFQKYGRTWRVGLLRDNVKVVTE